MALVVPIKTQWRVTEKGARAMARIEAVMCDCGHMSTPTDYTPGYGTDAEGKTHCFPCCSKNEQALLERMGRGVLYLVEKDGRRELTDWPGVFRVPVLACHIGRHNFASKRYDVWFRMPSDPFIWHGVTYGDNTQICHIRRTASKRL
jgi:hypothetical protein